MKIKPLCQIVVFFILFSSYSTDSNNQKNITLNPIVRQDHPYLFINSELAQRIKQKPELTKFSEYVEQRYKQSSTSSAQIQLIRKKIDEYTKIEKLSVLVAQDLSMYLGIDAYFNNDKISQAFGLAFVESLLNRNLSYLQQSSNDQVFNGKVYGLGLCYDWFYDSLNSEIKRKTREQIIETLEYIDSKWQFYSRPHIIGGHSRYSNYIALCSLLAIYNEIKFDSKIIQERYSILLNLVLKNWESGFLPAEEYICKGGGHPMGWSYGTSYTNPIPYLVWEFATNNPSWLRSFHAERVYFYLYALRNNNKQNALRAGGYDKFPFYGDAYPMEYSNFRISLQLLVSAHFYQNNHAKWLYRQLAEKNMHRSYWDILYKHFDETPGDHPDNLPLSRHFPNSGFVIIRDSWNFIDNTLFIFKSSSFYNHNHQHKDQNSFSIFYQAPLAIESGGYSVFGGYNSDHWKNYYTRSVAHNTILVYDPSEKFVSSGKILSNDGGQKFFKKGYPKLVDISQGGDNYLDGITAYEDNKHFTYIVGNAGKSYSQEKLKNFERSVLYVKSPKNAKNLIIIFDEVETTNTFKVSYLLHSINKPEVNGSITKISTKNTINNRQGILVHKTILPEKCQIDVIGGQENNKEFWVADDGKGHGKNYNQARKNWNTNPKHLRSMREAGKWRIEVYPTEPSRTTNFLHLIAVHENTHGKQDYGNLVKSEHYSGISIPAEESLILFRNKSTKLNTERIQISANIRRLILIGLENIKSVDLKRFENTIIITEKPDYSGEFKVSGNHLTLSI